MKALVGPLLALCILGAIGVVAFRHSGENAQSAATANTRQLTEKAAEDFLSAAGLQTCEIGEIDPMVSQVYHTLNSLSIGVAEDCGTYDASNPTVINVHQFADQQARDAMVSALQDLRFRALRPYGSVWVVDNFVIVLLGPQREEVEALIKAEYRRRHPKAG